MGCRSPTPRPRRAPWVMLSGALATSCLVHDVWSVPNTHCLPHSSTHPDDSVEILNMFHSLTVQLRADKISEHFYSTALAICPAAGRINFRAFVIFRYWNDLFSI